MNYLPPEIAAQIAEYLEVRKDFSICFDYFSLNKETSVLKCNCILYINITIYTGETFKCTKKFKFDYNIIKHVVKIDFSDIVPHLGGYISTDAGIISIETITAAFKYCLKEIEEFICGSIIGGIYAKEMSRDFLEMIFYVKSNYKRYLKESAQMKLNFIFDAHSCLLLEKEFNAEKYAALERGGTCDEIAANVSIVESITALAADFEYTSADAVEFEYLLTLDVFKESKELAIDVELYSINKNGGQSAGYVEFYMIYKVEAAELYVYVNEDMNIIDDKIYTQIAVIDKDEFAKIVRDIVEDSSNIIDRSLIQPDAAFVKKNFKKIRNELRDLQEHTKIVDRIVVYYDSFLSAIGI